MNVYATLQQTECMRASDAKQISPIETCDADKRKLILIWPQMGDFDTLEYAWWLVRGQQRLSTLDLEVRAIAIGNIAAGQKFCDYTGFPAQHLFVDAEASLHQKLRLYKGLSASLPGLNQQQKGYLNLLLMCAGIGSPGTLKEVFRGYLGDRTAPQLIADDETVKASPLPALKGEVFKRAGGKGFQRPFELATLRLRNMTEVLSHWKTYVPNAAYLTQRGATFLFDADGGLLYEWRDHNILGFAENMSDPLSFLNSLSLERSFYR